MNERLAVWLGVLRFEWTYQTRQLTFLAALVGMGFMGFTLVATGFGPRELAVNSPYVVMESLGMLSLIAVFVLTVFCAGAALREFESGMTEIIFATPIGKGGFLLARYAGVVLAAMTVMVVMTVLMAVLPFVLGLEPARVMPIRASTYLWALGTIVLPNLLWVTALLFAIALLSRSAVATYVGGVAIYGLYWVTALLIDSPIMAGAGTPTPEGLARAAILDPFGLSAFFEQTRYWTPELRNSQLTALSGHFLLNRLLWIGVAALSLAAAYRWFALRVQEGGRAAKGEQGSDATPRPETPYRPVAPGNGAAAAFAATVRTDLRLLFGGWTFIAFLLLWTFVAGMEAFGQLGGGEYGTKVLPTAGILLDALQLPLLLLGSVAVVYYGAEVAWRERVLGVDPLIDATPTSTVILFGGKALALATLPFVMGLVGVVIASGVQLLLGTTPVQIGAHLSLLWFGSFPVALLAVGVLLLQAVTPNRWVGMLAGLALVIIAQQGDEFGLEHPMLRFTAFPAVAHSEMDGFGPAPLSFAAFALYWSAATFLLGCLTWGLWRRGVDVGVLSRIRNARLSWGRTGTTLTAVAAILFGAGALQLWAVTEKNAAWESAAARLAWRADYERSYRHLWGRPQPVITSVVTRVDLEPRARRATLHATYRLTNRTASAIDTLWVAVPRGTVVDTILVDGAVPVSHDDRFQMYAFAGGMAPGAARELTFVGRVEQGGVRAGEPEYDVTENGTYLTSRGSYPSIGYRRGYELADPYRRTAAGLTGEATIPNGERDPWFTLEAVVSTDSDQTAIVTGELTEIWDSGGRRFFQYQSDGPITPNFGIVSARYAVTSEMHDGIRVEVWHDRAHASNVDRILTAATTTLDLLGSRFGRYRGKVLRIAEVPAWNNFGGFAHAGLILFTEDRGFLADPRQGDVDLVTRRVAHEVAHQWWGHVVDPVDGPGASVIVETLAKYSEQLTIAAIHGDSALPAMLRFDEDRYLTGRAEEGDAERTLVTTASESFLYYGKGAIAMHSLAGALGSERVDRALARLAQKEGGPAGGGTAKELEELLTAEAATPTQRALVKEWFEERLVDDVQVDSATVASRSPDRFEVEARVRGRAGSSVEYAIYGGTDDAPTLVATGTLTLTDTIGRWRTMVPERPSSIVLDPNIRRLDLDRSNNSARIKAE